MLSGTSAYQAGWRLLQQQLVAAQSSSSVAPAAISSLKAFTSVHS
jgi:hypothetical protein